ncbi:GPI mannosyltransferase [Achlya hypogyna]|uniref:Mannosyltransferase n=1 Tax=Achlya hypogyna TaxID=1202772 RepID=A0A1V9YPG0_ACHHY|nr:GPI mannosyltransferase [Achlya hypogyna]
MQGRWVAALVAFRLANALFVRTYYNPDEFWQSSEVAHHLVYGYGYLYERVAARLTTWEWQPDARLRGYAHPALFALLYKFLQLLGLDTPWAVAYGPRLLQGLLAAVGDVFLYKLAFRYLGEGAARWALFSQLTSWFAFYTLVRTYSNSVEAVCTTVALAFWPWAHETDAAKPAAFWRRAHWGLGVAAIGVVFRPTNAVLWLFLGLRLLAAAPDPRYLLLSIVAPIAAVALGAMLLIDRVGYGSWTFVPLNFVRFNVLEGKDALYGAHPWHWYLLAGFPEAAATSLPLALYGVCRTHRRELAALVLWALVVYSCGAHKEPRFLLPLLPPTFVYAGRGLQCLAVELPTKLFRLLVALCVLANGAAAIFLARYHQRAPLDVLDHLRDAVQRDPAASIDLFLPCHATPFYSHIHRNVPMWSPSCAPEYREVGTESDRVRAAPLAVAEERYAVYRPTFIVMYTSSAAAINPVRLASWGYVEDARFFHSQFNMDLDVPGFEAHMLVYRHTRKT